MMHFYKKLPLFKKGGKMLFLFFFTKFDQMSRLGSRDRHAGWRSKKLFCFSFDFNETWWSFSANYNFTNFHVFLMTHFTDDLSIKGRWIRPIALQLLTCSDTKCDHSVEMKAILCFSWSWCPTSLLKVNSERDNDCFLF